MATKKRPTTNEQIHAELKKLHLSVQVLTEMIVKVHDELKQKPKRKWFKLW